MTLLCEWCGQRFERPNQLGPIPKFCRQSHRQRAYEERRFERTVKEAVARSHSMEEKMK